MKSVDVSFGFAHAAEALVGNSTALLKYDFSNSPRLHMVYESEGHLGGVVTGAEGAEVGEVRGLGVVVAARRPGRSGGRKGRR